MRRSFVVAAGLLVFVGGCEAPYHSRAIKDSEDSNKLTVGTVQREIKQGMSAADVAAAMGSPNIVTADGSGNETWVYDRNATEVVASGSSWFVSAGASRSTQKNLTVVIRFDSAKRVQSVAYHQSSF